MKAVLQRASKAEVLVDGKITGSIGTGLLILLCVEHEDSEQECNFLAKKCAEMRIFPDEDGKMNKSLLDIGGAVLLISQFTLSAEWKKGRRPGFTGAARPEIGNRLYEYFGSVLESLGLRVEKGVFGAHMEVSLTNDGPVTLMLDYSADKTKA